MIAVRGRLGAARVAFFLLIGATCGFRVTAASPPEAPVPRVEPNDNRHAAGRLDGGLLTLSLRASIGRWRPEGAAGPALEVEAFGEVGSPLTVPAPLIRARGWPPRCRRSCRP